MGCCGQGRAALRASPARGSPWSRSSAATMLRYTGQRSVRVRGAATRRIYEFVRGESAPVATADVAALLGTGLFARE